MLWAYMTTRTVVFGFSVTGYGQSGGKCNISRCSATDSWRHATKLNVAQMHISRSGVSGCHPFKSFKSIEPSSIRIPLNCSIGSIGFLSRLKYEKCNTAEKC